MESLTLNSGDRSLLESRGITETMLQSQIAVFRKGIPFLKLDRPCTAGDGIERISEEDAAALITAYEAERGRGRAQVFVPASGAASRMFKSLLKVYNRDENRPGQSIEALRKGDEDDAAVAELMEKLEKFAFYKELEKVMDAAGSSLSQAQASGHYVPVLKYILTGEGLGYGDIPKGMVLFHKTPAGPHTPFEEHLEEAVSYVSDPRGHVRVHFTVPQDWKDRIAAHVRKAAARMESRNLSFEITFSCQKPSTDTLAVDLENRPFRDGEGNLVFRPGGHGALLENLNDLQGDIVFIKNIDNILPERRRAPVIHAQKLLGGFLVKIQNEVFGLLDRLERGDAGAVEDAADFAASRLGLQDVQSAENRTPGFLMKLLNRPVRICGMVKNEGEPGGGPFWVRSPDGSLSRQIVEKSQVNAGDREQKETLDRATHFNPVDLVCGLRNFRGEPFELSRFVDPETAFISRKSRDGRDLKALELPGLWNGAMAGWLSFFVEVPVETFGPVKVINDLLRDKHQAEGQS